MEYYKTQSRTLEQFLFVHRVYFDHQEQNDDGMTVWVYLKDEYLMHVLEEWKLVIARKRLVPSR